MGEEVKKDRDWKAWARTVGTLGGKVKVNKNLTSLYLAGGPKYKKRSIREIYFGGGGEDGLGKMRDLTNPKKFNTKISRKKYGK